jgi:Fur family transcriptional regulator, zinc uptake regulator
MHSPAKRADHSHDHSHDHGRCVATLLDRARHSFDEQGLRLTALRQRVLEEIAASHDAMGAYDVLDRLSRRTGERLAPISVYRAIDALLQTGLVHRLESRNAYFACHAPHVDRQRHMALVCDACAKVVELPAAILYDSIDAASDANGFQLKSAVAEGSGLCAACRI